MSRPDVADFRARFDTLAAIGRDADTGGLTRFAWTHADAAAGEWFAAQAGELGMQAEVDRNGNRWAWWGPAADAPDQAVATGSHLDTVPDGGAFDGALGVVAAFAAVAMLQDDGWQPRRPVAVVAWADEEGARSNIPCCGSRLSAGTLDPADVLARTDRDGIALADAVTAFGLDPGRLGADLDRLTRLSAFVELHVEQGRGLVFHDTPVGVGTGIDPHGRWLFVAEGETNHAGTTSMTDRCDPMPVLATLVEAARREALSRGALATVGRVTVHPGAANAVPGRVEATLDVRGRDEQQVRSLVAAVDSACDAAATGDVTTTLVEQAFTPAVAFDAGLRDRLVAAVRATGGEPELLATAAGHDAGALAGAVATGMLYVRNPGGASHTPAEHANDADCLAGIRALAAALRDLAGAP